MKKHVVFGLAAPAAAAVPMPVKADADAFRGNCSRALLTELGTLPTNMLRNRPAARMASKQLVTRLPVIAQPGPAPCRCGALTSALR